AVAFYDFDHRVEWSLHAERWFHAASTIKVPVLLGVYDAIERGELEPHSRVHVRNRFLSITDGTPFRVEAGRAAHRHVPAPITSEVPRLLGVYDAIERGELQPHSRVHVRNRFLSIIDGKPFRVEGGRDANSVVHAAIGRTMTVRELAFHMITTSSNLATNLL